MTAGSDRYHVFVRLRTGDLLWAETLGNVHRAAAFLTGLSAGERESYVLFDTETSAFVRWPVIDGRLGLDAKSS